MANQFAQKPKVPKFGQNLSTYFSAPAFEMKSKTERIIHKLDSNNL